MVRSSVQEPQTSNRPGRPRNPATDEGVLDATLEQLASLGYARMTIDAVAADAGVDKPSIYRRWPSKADLATAALLRLQAGEPPPVTRSPRRDLVTLLTTFGRQLLRPNGMTMIGTLLVEEQHTPELIALFRERIVKRRRAMVSEVLERALAAGQLRRGADLDATVNLLIGSFYARYLSGEKVPSDWAERVVKTVWEGISTSGRS
jgi:AcrR family transcriptional regulator